jgi:hypothetical protein
LCWIYLPNSTFQMFAPFVIWQLSSALAGRALERVVWARVKC